MRFDYHDSHLKSTMKIKDASLWTSGRRLGVKFQHIFTDNCTREMKVAKLSCQTSSFTRQDYYDPAFLVQRWRSS
jgi:hypothetical protein